MKQGVAWFALASFCFVIGGTAIFADARMGRKRDSRPRALIAVRDESLALQNKIIDDFCLVRFDAPRFHKDDSAAYKIFLDDYLREPKEFFEGKACAFNPEIHRMVVVSPEFFYFGDAADHYALLPTRNFIAMFAKEFYDSFRELKITDTLRTRKEHEILIRQKKTKANGITHGRQSAHLSGAAFDISRRGLTPQQNRWIERKLIWYIEQGKIVAVEEMWNNAFHIMVCPNWQTGSCF